MIGKFIQEAPAEMIAPSLLTSQEKVIMQQPEAANIMIGHSHTLIVVRDLKV